MTPSPKTPDPIGIATVLVETLDEENAALSAFDFTRSTALLTRKMAAVTAFRASMGRPAPTGDATETHALDDRLRRVAEENRRLLLHAIELQRRLTRVIHDAALQRLPSGPGYNHLGRALPETVSPIAVTSVA